MSTKKLSRRQARWSKFLSRFNFKIIYKPGTQCKADALTRRSQDLPLAIDPRNDYMEQILLKPKNLDLAPIRILKRHELNPIDIPIEEEESLDLKAEIEAAYQELDPEELVAKTRQQILSGERQSNKVSLSDCSVENNRLFYFSWLWVLENSQL